VIPLLSSNVEHYPLNLSYSILSVLDDLPMNRPCTCFAQCELDNSLQSQVRHCQSQYISYYYCFTFYYCFTSYYCFTLSSTSHQSFPSIKVASIAYSGQYPGGLRLVLQAGPCCPPAPNLFIQRYLEMGVCKQHNGDNQDASGIY
jgi:hypothetical protein